MASPRKTFTTQKGTELPLMNLKGKEYLQVAHRLVWFREQHPEGILKTTMIERQGEGPDEYAVFRSEVYVETARGPMCVSTGHKRECRKDFADFIEKAETGSIGRALALAGFGTQFTGDDLDEQQRLADAPVEVITASSATVGETSAANGDGNGTSATIATLSKRSSFRKNAAVATPSEDI